MRKLHFRDHNAARHEGVQVLRQGAVNQKVMSVGIPNQSENPVPAKWQSECGSIDSHVWPRRVL